MQWLSNGPNASGVYGAMRPSRVYRSLLLLLAISEWVGLTACNTSSTTQTPRTQPTASSALAGLPACRLPVSRAQLEPGNAFPPHVGGFLDLATGRYSEDANSSAVLDSPGGRVPTIYMTKASPVLRGSDAWLGPAGAPMTYDSAFARWLPVNQRSVSPDGTRFAYVDVAVQQSQIASRVHIVDVQTGADHVVVFPGPGLSQPTQFFAGVVAYTSQGVYLSLFGSNQGAGPDSGKLWLLDPDRGTMHKVTDVVGNSWLVAGSYGWTMLPSATASNPNRLVRLELNTGQLDVWWVDANYEPVSSTGAITSLNVIGVTGDGSPIVEGAGEVGNGADYTPVVDIWVIRAPDEAMPLDVSAADVASRSTMTWDGSATDSAGAWILLNDRLFLYRADGTFRKVASGPYSPSGACT